MNTQSTATEKHPITFQATIAFLFLNILLAATALAGSPRVHFDVHPLVACQDVTTDEFARMNPSDRLVEAKLQVSSLIKSGREGDLIEFFYRIQSPRGSVQVVDYTPKTSMTTDYASNIAYENKNEKVRSLGLTASGGYQHLVKGNASAEIGSKKGSIVRYELVPEMQQLAASGTMRRGTAVYFKLKPGRQISLEGSKQFTLVMRVPRSWRADLLHVYCRAQGYERGVVRPLDEKTISGSNVFPLAIYLAGDQQARAIATNVAVAETRLRRIADLKQKEIEKRSYPSVAHKVGAFFSAVDPKIPKDWVFRVILSPSTSRIGDYENHLPQDVRKVAQAYVAAKARIYDLNGWRAPMF
jgi:hypothetical protein